MMIRMIRCAGTRPLGMAVMAGFLWAAALPAGFVDAQLIPKEESEFAPAKVDLDVHTLLVSPIVSETTASDEIWQLRARAGRELIQIPFIVKPSETTSELTSSSVKIKGGSLIAWRLTELPVGVEPDSREAGEYYARYLDVPRFAKSVEIEPSGQISYRVERVIIGGDVRRTTLPYAMFIDRELLNRRAPTPPNRTNARTPAERAAQMRSFARYREQQQEFNFLRQTVNNLDSTIVKPLPHIVWGVFDVLSTRDELELEFADGRVWTISMRLLNDLRGEARQGNVRRGVQDDRRNRPQRNDRVFVAQADRGDGRARRVLTVVNLLSALANDRHPLSQRLSAYALAETEVVSEAQLGDSLFFIIKGLLEGNDGEARRVVIRELVNTLPPTRATINLLKLVAETEITQDPGEKIEAFLAQFNQDLSRDPTRVNEIIQMSNQLLSEETGPAPSFILESIVSEANQAPAVIPAFIQGIRFHGLSPQRLADALIYLVESAGVERLAAGWLDVHFLGATNPDLVRQSLEVIAEADTGSRSLGPAVRSAVMMIFGEARADASEGVIIRKAKLSDRIPINSARHGVFRALEHGDFRIRQMAWEALPNFRMTSEAPEGEDPGQRYKSLMAAALSQMQTPPQVVDFTVDQPDRAHAGRVLLQVVLRGSEEASRSAAQALIGSGMPLGDILLEQNYGERQGFAMRMYNNIQRSFPDVTAVMRQRLERNPTVIWFGRQIAEGNLPETREWINAFDTEETLLRLGASRDPDLSKGALSVLVSAAGGTSQDTNTLVTTFNGLSDRSVSNLEKEWNQVRKGIYIERLNQRAGAYELVLRVGPEISDRPAAAPQRGVAQPTRRSAAQPQGMDDRPPWVTEEAYRAAQGQEPQAPPPASSAQAPVTPAAAPPQFRDIPLGVIQLSVTDGKVSLGIDALKVETPDNTPELVLRVASLAGLKTLPVEAIQEFPLDAVNRSVDLVLQGDHFAGKFLLGRRDAELVLKPTALEEDDASDAGGLSQGPSTDRTAG